MATTDHQRILSLQSFYGGSHRQFIDSWCRHSRHAWQQLTLPARHWKWRMRHSAIYFAAQMDRYWQSGERWSAVMCTDMTNLAELRGLLRSEARQLPFILYFHENQFEYPNQQSSERDLHFGFTNFVSAIAADHVWFNSEYNRQSFLCHLNYWLDRWPDFAPRDSVIAVAQKSTIQSPGIETNFCGSSAPPAIGPHTDRPMSAPTHIIWAARWEHDKNPNQLLQILELLHGTGMDFVLSVIGQQFRQIPDAFESIQEKFGERINHWGFLSNREDYWHALRSADVFLSTANHEFFGIAAVEAIACGCFPLLPKRLSYPGLLSLESNPERHQFFYATSNDAAETLQAYHEGKLNSKLMSQLRTEIRDKYNWKCRALDMDVAVTQMCDSGL